jgi:type VI secretion system secreted protein VgrG
LSGGLNLTQHERVLEIASPLGAKALTLRRLSVREAIGQPFLVTAEVISENMDLKPTALVGKAVTCSVRVGHVEMRHFHGIVRSFARLGPFGRGLAAYRLETVPRLWQLCRTSDCRIFQDKSVKDIASTIFGEHEVAPVRWGGSVPSQKRPYCVQFNETDLDFVQRLFDETGCGYYFAQAAGDHTLVVCGANADYPLVPGDPQVVRDDREVHGALIQWRPGSALQPGRVAAQDFDGLKPSSLLNAHAGTILGTPNASSFEMYRWPGGQHVRPEGDLSKLGMEGFEAGADRVTASGNDPTVFAGGRLKVRPGLDVMQPVTWLVASVEHEAFDETHLSGGGGAGYSNEITLQPADRPWRPSAPRPRPAMAGLHSAIVTGPAGEEIHCDEYGRVKVHFLWDRAGKRDDTSSCWVRVAQAYAGAWGGSQMLPRVKDEVLVGFVDGDPDRPVILGSLYNAESKPVYALPANKTQSGFRTRSSKSGSASNFNELRFEDKKGSEEVNFQAEKDFKLLTKNNRDEEVGNNRTTVVTKGHDTLTVKMGNIATEASKGNISTVAKMGNISVKADLGKIELNAMQSITLTCGTSKIHMTPVGITLEAMQIDVKAKLMLNTEGVMANHKASALMIVKGGLVLIN